MATDYDAAQITLNYEGGSLSMALGNAKSLFGTNFDQLSGEGKNVTVAVSAHQRFRVIGQPPTNVSAHQYTYKQWPTSEAGGARGGQVVILEWATSEGEWTGRITGSCSKLGIFLDTFTNEAVTFRTQSGTKYGPFNKTNIKKVK